VLNKALAEHRLSLSTMRPAGPRGRSPGRGVPRTDARRGEHPVPAALRPSQRAIKAPVVIAAAGC